MCIYLCEWLPLCQCQIIVCWYSLTGSMLCLLASSPYLSCSLCLNCLCVCVCHWWMSLSLAWPEQCVLDLDSEERSFSFPHHMAMPPQGQQPGPPHTTAEILCCRSDGPYSFLTLRMVWKWWSIQRGRGRRRLWTVYREQKLLSQRKVFSMIHRLTCPHPSPQSALAVSW